MPDRNSLTIGQSDNRTSWTLRMTMHSVNPPAPSSSRAEIAQWLASRGFYVFRLMPNGKRPYADGWQEEATNDPVEARLLFAGACRDCNIGIRAKGLIVVDLDAKGDKDGAGEWAKLLAEFADTISGSTMQAVTPTGGRHLFFRLPEGADEVRNTAGSIADGIDTRGAGGYVVAHGSTIDGRPYVLSGDILLQAPPWLLAVNGAGRKKRVEADQIDGTLDRPQDIEAAIEAMAEHRTVIQGGRNNALFVMAKRLRDRGISRRMARTLLFEHFIETKLVPAMEHDEAHACINSAYDNNTVAGGEMQAANVFESVAALVGPPPALPVDALSSVTWSGPPPYVVKGLITRGVVGMITGTSEAGKSPIMLDIATRVALGVQWQGHKTKRSYVLHISTEGGAGLSGRYEAQKRRLDEEGTPIVDGVPIDVIETSRIKNATLVDDEATPGLANSFIKKVIETVKQRSALFGVEPGLVIFDTFSPLLGGKSDSDDGACREALAHLRRITAATGAAVMFVHHPTKAKAGQGGSTYRGSSVLSNDTDVQLWAEREEGEPGELTVPRVKDWGPVKPIPYSIEQVVLVEDDGEGDKVTSIVVQYGEAKPSAKTEFAGIGGGPGGGDPLSKQARRLLVAMCNFALNINQGDIDMTLAAQFDNPQMKAFARAKGAITDSLNQLQGNKLVVVSVKDRGAKWYRLTPAGMKYALELNPNISTSGFSSPNVE